MEKEMRLYDFGNRLSGTFLRLGWLFAVAAFVPVLAVLALWAAAVFTALYVLILFVLTIITLGMLLLNENFRAMYDVGGGIETVSSVVDGIIRFYVGAMPLFLAIGLAMNATCIVLTALRKSASGKVGRIVGASISAALLVIAAIVFYGYAINVQV